MQSGNTTMQLTTKKERPILFSGEMVRAILDSRKTQTRRVIKPQPIADSLYADGGWTWRLGKPNFIGASNGLFQSAMIQHCPYGKPGDRLWVRETFSLPLSEPCYRSDKACPQVTYNADGDTCWPARKRPSIHMPRWASRILLEIIDIHVERLQDIEREDVYAEGIHGPGIVVGEVFMLCTGQPTIESAEAKYILDQFIDLWDSFNAKRGYGWDQNLWVWVIEFKRLDES